MHHYQSCPLCGAKQFSKFLEVKDYTVSGERFQITGCDSCSFKFTNPRPADVDLGKYYLSENYISHSETKKGLIAKAYHLVRKRTLKQKLALVSRFVSRGAILDYGAGTGGFVHTCQQAGWNAFGVEPDQRARNTAFEAGLNVSASKAVLDSRISDLRFNAITLWHVLEHVTDPTDTLQYFKRKLTREGVLVIAVPNYTSFDAQYYGEFWAAYDVPRHLYHFAPLTIEKLLQQNGFKLVETLPMKFDSYYVSLLSEKYKRGKTHLLKAFWTGFTSNFRARSATEYSSVIYIFRPV